MRLLTDPLPCWAEPASPTISIIAAIVAHTPTLRILFMSPSFAVSIRLVLRISLILRGPWHPLPRILSLRPVETSSVSPA
jgi:hypothetical protein